MRRTTRDAAPSAVCASSVASARCDGASTDVRSRRRTIPRMRSSSVSMPLIACSTRSSIRSGGSRASARRRARSVGRRSGDNGGECIPNARRQSPARARTSAAARRPAGSRRARATSPSSSTAAASKRSCRSTAKREHHREAVNVVVAVELRRAVSTERRRDTPRPARARRDLGGKVALHCRLEQDGHAGTATGLRVLSKVGGSAVRSTSRLSTPSTVSRTHWLPDGTSSPSWNVSVDVAVECASAMPVGAERQPRVLRRPDLRLHVERHRYAPRRSVPRDLVGGSCGSGAHIAATFDSRGFVSPGRTSGP